MGYNIKKLREQKFPGRGGQSRAAEALGVTPQAWGQFESASNLNSATLEKIATLFGVEVSELTNDKASPPAPISGDQAFVFRERIAMDMKKAFQLYREKGSAPFIMRTHFEVFECRIVYKIEEIGDTKAQLVASYPLTRQIADRILAGEIDPNSEDAELWRLGQVILLIDYAAVMSIEFILK